MGALAVALLFATLALGGCVGGIGQTSPDAGDDSGPASVDDSQDNRTPTNGDGGIDEEANESVQDDGSGADESEPAPPRTPDDAMPGHEPADTKEGMAHFVIEGSGQVAMFGLNDEDLTFPIDDPGDVTFFDAYLYAEDKATWDVDYDLLLFRGDDTEADPIADGSTSTSRSYLWWQPRQGEAENFTLMVDADNDHGVGWTLEVWVWTSPDWNASHPWTDVFVRSYEWGQVEVNAQAAAVSVTGGWTYGPAARQGTSDDSWDFGGYIWYGCGNDNNVNVHPNGSGPRSLPCPETPYVSMGIVIQDDLAGQEVAAILTTCSNDGDNWCGETDNVNQEETCRVSIPLIGGITCVHPGPNEIRASFCGVISGITRDTNDDRDGTGPGLWDQRGQQYEAGNGTMLDHPGVDNAVLFLRGPQRGGGAVCPDANPYTGPTSGTITIIAFKG